MSDLVDVFARVNFEVNGDIRYRTDMELYGRADFWAVVQGRGEGDCDDYTLTKRARLLAAAVPLELLRIAVVFTETAEGRERLGLKRGGAPSVMGDHAVLIAREPGGDWVMDNRFSTLMPFSETGYDLDRIQVVGRHEWEHGVLPTT